LVSKTCSTDVAGSHIRLTSWLDRKLIS